MGRHYTLTLTFIISFCFTFTSSSLLQTKIELLPYYCNNCVPPNTQQFTFLGSLNQFNGIQGGNLPRNFSTQVFSHINYFASLAPTTWDEAEKECWTAFGPSASLFSLQDTPDQLHFLQDSLHFTSASSSSYWTTGRYWRNTKTWRWGSGALFPSRPPWASGYPKVSSLTASSRVVLVLPSNQHSGLLETQDASDLARYICQLPIATLEPLNIEYQVHLQGIGWEPQWHSSGETAGITGQSRRLEAIRIRLTGAPSHLKIKYSAHVQSEGWQGWVNSGGVAGTTGESRRLEALRIKLEGAEHRLSYRAHVEGRGWLGWVGDGDIAGTVGESRRLEAIQIKLTSY